MSFYNHLDRQAAGSAINRRNFALEALSQITGQSYSELSRQMQAACEDAPGIARHTYEAHWAERQLKKAQK